MKFVLALAAGVALAATFSAAPAAAQRGERVLVIFGNDKCPTSNGEEIVVCARKSENERYRIPQELREAGRPGATGIWAERVQSLEYVGAAGTESCSPVGAGGATGCMKRMFRKARNEKRAEGSEANVRF